MINLTTVRCSIPMRILALFCLLTSYLIGTAQPAGYGYGKVVTIQASQVSGSQTNFPVLIDVIDPNLRTTANGGHVRNVNGWDIIFTRADGVTLLNYQLERYVATTGEFVVWVSVPAISSAADIQIGMYYGNASVVANGSTTAVWDANYIGVWHFGGALTDGTSNGRTLTNSATPTSTYTTSKIGYGRQLGNNPFVASNSGSCQYLKLPNNTIGGLTNFTFEGWVYLDDNTTNWERVFDFGRSTTINMFLCPSITTNGVKRFAITTSGNAGEQQVSSATTAGATAWHHYAVTVDNSNNTATLYFDGAVDATNTTVTLRPTNMAADNADYFGRSQYAADDGLYGKFDEFRLSSSVRSASWIQTAYSNQNSPTTFSLMSAEMTAAATMLALPVALHSFRGSPVADGSVQLVWITEAESNNKQFIVQHSAGDNHWTDVQTIAAANSGLGEQQYTALDKTPFYPVSYYRLKQVDIDGKETNLSTIAVQLSSAAAGNITLYPNPANDHVAILLKNNVFSGTEKLTLTDALGRVFTAQFSGWGNTLSLQTKQLPDGIYSLTISDGGMLYSQKLVIRR